MNAGSMVTAVSGSLSPLPVMTQTTLLWFRRMPPRASFNKPATEAADAGSQKMPSSRAIIVYASRISSSVTESIVPPDSSRALTAFFQLAGLPTRMAEATVSGVSMGCPFTMAAAPSASKPIIFGGAPIHSIRCASWKPIQYAVILPALPTGMKRWSGAAPRSSMISNAAVFCPSSLYGLTELTSTTGCFAASSRTIRNASSKPPSMSMIRAP